MQPSLLFDQCDSPRMYFPQSGIATGTLAEHRYGMVGATLVVIHMMGYSILGTTVGELSAMTQHAKVALVFAWCSSLHYNSFVGKVKEHRLDYPSMWPLTVSGVFCLSLGLRGGYLEGSHSGLVRPPAKRLSREIGIVGSNPAPSASWKKPSLARPLRGLASRF